MVSAYLFMFLFIQRFLKRVHPWSYLLQTSGVQLEPIGFSFFFPQKINLLSQESLNDSMNVALMRINNYALQLSLN